MDVSFMLGALTALLSSMTGAWFNHYLTIRRMKFERKADQDQRIRDEFTKGVSDFNINMNRRLRYGSTSAVVLYRLLILTGEGPRNSIPVNTHVFVIGKDPDACDFVFSDPNIADAHLRLIAAGKVIVLEDISGGYGVQINGTPMVGPTVLSHNDFIVFGKSEIRFKEER